ncbi:hypothetical protein M758_9G178600 [Ceratodon purpureus]|nr:hypothetical protein M758_9G178600 [Ceratodon purpureus]
MLIFSIIFAYASWRSRPCVLVCSIFTIQRNCLSVWCEGLSFASQFQFTTSGLLTRVVDESGDWMHVKPLTIYDSLSVAASS